MQDQQHYAPSTVSRRLSCVCGYYKYAVIDPVLTASPAQHVLRPRRPADSTSLGITHPQFEAVLVRSRELGPQPHALVVLLSMLGLRVSEACAATITDLGMQHGHRVLLVHGKGGTTTLMPLPPAVARAIDTPVADRTTGPLLLTRQGRQVNRHAARRTVISIGRRAGITGRVHPHVLRHAFVTTLLDAGVSLRDVQIAARHADPRTTTRYDRARRNLDRHAVYLLASYMSGAT